MTTLLNDKPATVEDIHRVFETHSAIAVWRSSMASLYTMPELTNWVTQALYRLGIECRARKGFLSQIIYPAIQSGEKISCLRFGEFDDVGAHNVKQDLMKYS